MTSYLDLERTQDRPIAQRLCREFRAVLPPSVVYRTLVGAEHDLQGQIAPRAWEEMVYRLAQYRLDQIDPGDAQR